MKRRDFVKTGALFAVGSMLVPLSACTDSKDGEGNTEPKEIQETPVTKVFTLPDLPYAEDALEPYIDARTMGIHHGKHHAGYVKKLNAALEGHAMAGKDLAAIVSSVQDVDGDIGLRNNGGGHYNHSLFWKVMNPGGGAAPSGQLAEAINSTFGSYDDFKTEFAGAAATQFGSGWAWLSVDGGGKLFVSSTPNQDNPMMANLVDQSGTPILGIDVWEHAYYLKYQNKRKEYIDNFFNVVNWEEVAKNFNQIG